jgi:large subunit ribosomal protein L22
MKKATAKHYFLRQSPRKVQEVARLIRKKDVPTALRILSFTQRAACSPLKKLLLSALNNLGKDEKSVTPNVRVSELLIDQGPTHKRWMPRAQGRATPINKRTTNIKMTLEEKVF